MDTKRDGRDRDAELARGGKCLKQRQTDSAGNEVSNSRGETQQGAKKNHCGVRSQITQIQRGTQPHEEERAEETLGHTEELPGQSVRFTNGRQDQPERESGEQDRQPGKLRDRSESEKNHKAQPELKREPVPLRVFMEPPADTEPLKAPKHQAQGDGAPGNR